MIPNGMFAREKCDPLGMSRHDAELESMLFDETVTWHYWCSITFRLRKTPSTVLRDTGTAFPADVLCNNFPERPEAVPVEVGESESVNNATSRQRCLEMTKIEAMIKFG